MNKLPVVSIVGRPNVGKSSLFNRILHKRIAVVDGLAGVTRDRNYVDTSWNDVEFTIVDTGGLVPESKDNMHFEVNLQVEIAIEESCVVVFVVEAGLGPTDLDMSIANRLRKKFSDKVILVVNKAEKQDAVFISGEYMSLGLGEPLLISALHGQGVADLLDGVSVFLKMPGGGTPAGSSCEELRIAVLGRPNVGKSSFVNAILNQKRMIVDDVPGTTRDSIDSTLIYQGRQVRLIDTAGLRRKSQVKDDIEYFSNLRTVASIERSEICVLLIDSSDGVREQELKILEKIGRSHKGVIVCLNKWDLVTKDGKTFDSIANDMRKQCKELRHVPIISISALTGKRVANVLDAAFGVQSRMAQSLNQSDFEQSLLEWVRGHPHPFNGRDKVRILGGKQKRSRFPLFELYCTNASFILPSYRRYLVNKIYEKWDFSGCPVILAFRPAGRHAGKKLYSGLNFSKKER